MRKKFKVLITVIAAFVFVIVVIVIAMLSRGEKISAFNKHMELAQRYLEELKYEQAIAEYETAIEIEPNNEEAYLALAEVYVQMEDYESAIVIANQGIEETKAEELNFFREEILKQYEEVQTPETPFLNEMKAADNFMHIAEKGIKKNIVNHEDGSYEIKFYDIKGKQLAQANYNTFEILMDYRIYEYDEDGYLIRVTTFNIDGEERGFDIYGYDEERNLAGISSYDATGKLDFVKEYDMNGKLKRQIVYFYTYFFDSEGTISSYFINEYDENENCIKQSWYDESNRITYSAENDANGNPLRETYYNADGTIWSEWIYTYNDDGTVTMHH